MYKFVDTNQATHSTPLPSEALNFNGQFLEKVIPGYQTLSVSGRELVPSEIESYQLGFVMANATFMRGFQNEN